MTGALLPMAHVPAWGETRFLQSNSYVQSRQGKYDVATGGRTVRLRSSRQYVEDFPRKQLLLLLRPYPGNYESCKCRPRNSSFKIPRMSARLGGFCRCLAHQDAICRSGRFVHDNHCSFVTDLPRPPSSARRDSTVRRVQSIEGAEKSPSPDVNLDQKKLESLTDGQEGSRETEEVHRQESVPVDASTGNAEQVDPESSDEKKILDTDEEDTSGSPQDGTIPVTSHDESDEVSNDTAKGITPTEELQDFGTGEDWEEGIEYVTRISVPRQKYIPVPKVDLVNALLSSYFPANKDASKFLSICSYLEIILHAEHKVQLEELRSDYSLTHSVQVDSMPESSNFLRTKGATNSSKLGTANTERAQKHATVGELTDWPIDSPAMEDGSIEWGKLLPVNVLTDLATKFMAPFKQQDDNDKDALDAVKDDSPGPSSDSEASEAATERFQKNILRMLGRAEFEGISVRDLELTAALNPDYLLTLPVDVDWKRTSSSNVKIFKRGYTKEEQKGLLLGEKLDYLQALIFRQTFKRLTGPLLFAGRWCLQKWNSLWDDKEGRELAESVSRWLQEPLQLGKDKEPLDTLGESTEDETHVQDKEDQLDMPIWLAAGQAIPRYEAVLSSAGSRGMLIRRILVRMGLLPSEPPPSTLSADADENLLEAYLRPSHLSRVSMKDIWITASKAVVGRNIIKKISSAFSAFFSETTLQEPAFKELVLLYNGDDEGDSEQAGLQLQTYRKIPLADLKIVFPSKKLIYRVLDTLKLDITSIAGLLAFMVNYRFDDIRSSPSAFILDIIAISALVVFATRVVFGYKQVWDRYQLLVNKTLYEKTVARGFGVVQFLLDQSEEQQFKEAILVFVLLVHQGKTEKPVNLSVVRFIKQGMTTPQLEDSCARFLYYTCKEQVELPVESAVNTLLKFGLIAGNEEGFETSTDTPRNADVRFKALPYEQGLRALEQHWVSQPSNMPLWN